MRVRKSSSQWSAIIATFQRSGESHRGFCAKRGLEVGTFRTWLYKLRRAAENVEASAPILLPIEITPSLPAREPELVIAVAGVELRFAASTDPSYVAGLVAELRARC